MKVVVRDFLCSYNNQFKFLLVGGGRAHHSGTMALKSDLNSAKVISRRLMALWH